MVQPLELHQMTLFELFAKIQLPDQDFENWLVSQGLLHGSMPCENCNQPMNDVIKGGIRLWVCEHQGCRFGPNNKNMPTKGFYSV
jgi:predicted peroxiredoxin